MSTTVSVAGFHSPPIRWFINWSGDGTRSLLLCTSSHQKMTSSVVISTPSDLPALRSGLLTGVRGLSGCSIEQHEAEVVGELLTLEARFTFYDGVAARKRWIRLLYQGSTQVRLIAQGASINAFVDWEPMFFEAMRTVHFGDQI